ncbi:MAG TPA: hypothetical protein VNA14_02595 [Mycobacteriales bacterium]|nr:hypothetical protein [Mycobacteriales bacterium]
MDSAYSQLTLARSRVKHVDELRQRHSDQVIRRRVRSGAWTRMSRSVYLVASDHPTWFDRVVAAALATGLDDVVVCGPTAAELLGMEGADLAGPIHLCSAAPNARRAVGRGVVMHQLKTYDADVVVIAGIRVGSPMRTVKECARTLSPHKAVVVIESAIRGRLVTLDEVTVAFAGLRHDRGVVQARQALDRVDLRSESGLETECRLILADARIPPTSLQTVVVEHGTAYRLDLAYDELNVGIEVDGREGRSREARLVGDRRRQNAIVRRRAWVILRFTAYDIRRDPAYVVRTVREALAAAAAAA